MGQGNKHVSFQLSHQESDLRLNQANPDDVNKTQFSERRKHKSRWKQNIKTVFSLKENDNTVSYSSLCVLTIQDAASP